MSFAKIPKNVLTIPRHFALHIPDSDIEEFKSLLAISKIGPTTWYNNHTDGRFGLHRKWLSQAKEAWMNLDWRKQEERINSYPNFKTIVNSTDCGPTSIHFAALFSAKEDALPVIFMHGWPGSFLEFLPMFDILTDRYTPDTLPYHVIVPSLPGYGLSSGPVDVELTMGHAAYIMNQLMVDLGFRSGYVAQGGDVGSFLARQMSVAFDECKAIHVNMLAPPGNHEITKRMELLSVEELHRIQRMTAFFTTGSSYALEHGFRPAAIGLVLSSSPLALLAWIGEKYIEWVDPRHPLTLDTILAMTSFYWFTSTFPRSLYPYRPLAKSIVEGGDVPLPTSTKKALGYSVFPNELFILPRAWAESIYQNILTYTTHQKGGHFAALEQPEAFLDDVEEFLLKVKTTLQL